MTPLTPSTNLAASSRRDGRVLRFWLSNVHLGPLPESLQALAERGTRSGSSAGRRHQRVGDRARGERVDRLVGDLRERRHGRSAGYPGRRTHRGTPSYGSKPIH